MALLAPRSPSSSVPTERSVSFGFEDVVTDRPRWESYVHRLDDVQATAVSLAVGRVDWTAFPWARFPEAHCAAVRDSGRDYVAEALAALSEGQERRTITLTLDVLAPKLLSERPDLAGVDTQGRRSELFASVHALDGGELGDRIIELSREVCFRYRPDRLALTELLFDHHTFGTGDLLSYRRMFGRDDWPRTTSGLVDDAHHSIAQWRSRAISSLLARVSDVAADYGVAVDMDVRAPWDDPRGDRSLSGHNYRTLLESCDRITVWNYFGLSSRGPDFGAEIVRSLTARYPGRFVMSTGLWSDGANTISAEDLAQSVAAVQQAGANAVSVTPASRMTPLHWSMLADQWA